MDPIEDIGVGSLAVADTTLAVTDTIGDLIGDEIIEPLEKEFSTSNNQLVDLSNNNNQLTSQPNYTQNVMSQNNYSLVDGGSSGGKLFGTGVTLAGAAAAGKTALDIYHEIYPEAQEVKVEEYNEDTNRKASLDRAIENGENYHQYLPGNALVHNMGNFAPGAIPINNPIGSIPAVAANNKSMNFNNPNLPNFNPNMPQMTNRQQAAYNNIINSYGASHL